MAQLPLQEELKTFKQMKKALLRRHEGEYALIQGNRLIETGLSEKKLCRIGIRMFGSHAFLIKKIERVERQQTYTSGLIKLR